jgi:hypothetical protein
MLMLVIFLITVGILSGRKAAAILAAALYVIKAL